MPEADPIAGAHIWRQRRAFLL